MPAAEFFDRRHPLLRPSGAGREAPACRAFAGPPAGRGHGLGASRDPGAARMKNAPAGPGRDQAAACGVSLRVFHREYSTPPAIIATVTPSEIAGSTFPTIWFQKILAPMNTSTIASAYFR